MVGTPYLDEINTAEGQFLVEKGFDVLDIQALNIETGIEFGQMTPAYWKKFAIEIDQLEADVVFLSCSGIRALEVVDEVEQAIGKLVALTINNRQTFAQRRLW